MKRFKISMLYKTIYVMVAVALPLSLLTPSVVNATTTTVTEPIMTDIGTLSGGTTSQALGMNNLGQVVGNSDFGGALNGATHAFLWNPTTTTMSDLTNDFTASIGCGSFNGCSTNAVAINSTGTIVGTWTNTIFGGSGGFVLTSSGTVTNIPNFTPTAINDNGLIVGQDTANNTAAEYNSAATSPVVTDLSLKITKDTNGVSSSPSFTALGINTNNQIVGWYLDASNTQEAVVWTTPTTKIPSGVLSLGDLGGATQANAIGPTGIVAGTGTDAGQQDAFTATFTTAGVVTITNIGQATGNGSGANAISTRNVVAGYSNSISAQVASTWATHLTTTATPVGFINGGTYTVGNAVNSLGEVAGYGDFSGATNGATHAFFWDPKGKIVTTVVKEPVMTDIGALPGGTTSQALGMNNAGQVVGNSDFTGSSNGYTHPFLWNPTTQSMYDISNAFGSKIPCGSPTVCNASAVAINNYGTVVGTWNNTLFGNNGGFIYTATGAVTNIPNFTPTAINDNGLIVGQDTATNTAAEYNSAATTPVVTDLPVLSNGTGTGFTALGVNNNGQIVGDYYSTSNSVQEAVVWTTPNKYIPSGVLSIGDLGGGTQANAIGPTGIVVGFGVYPTDGNPTDAFTARFTSYGTFSVINIGEGSFGNGSAATSISSTNKIAGYSDSKTNPIASTWASYSTTTPVQIGVIGGGTYSYAMGINGLGEVVGYGDFGGASSGQTHAFFYNPKQVVTTVKTIL